MADAGEPTGSPVSGFTDLPAGQFYTEGVNWLKATGITTGMTETIYAPASVVTRSQMVTFLYRFALRIRPVPIIAFQHWVDVPVGTEYKIIVTNAADFNDLLLANAAEPKQCSQSEPAAQFEVRIYDADTHRVLLRDCTITNVAELTDWTYFMGIQHYRTQYVYMEFIDRREGTTVTRSNIIGFACGGNVGPSC